MSAPSDVWTEKISLLVNHNMGRREDLDDDESTVTISFPDGDPQVKSSSSHGQDRDRHSSGLSAAQSEQLKKAREVALNNRRVRLRAKLEKRLIELKSVMGDFNDAQLERVVKVLVETEDKHRSRQTALTESLTEQLKKVYDEIHKVRKDVEKATSKRVGTLSDVSSVSASVRG